MLRRATFTILWREVVGFRPQFRPRQFTQSAEKPPSATVVASVLRVEGDKVELGNKRLVQLDSARRETRGLAPILEGLRALRQPVYFELDPTTSAITQIKIPVVGHVVNLRSSEKGFDVELDNSHARHRLQPSDPKFSEHERELREAMRSRRPVIVTGDDTGGIVDVRAFTPGPDGDPWLPPIPKPDLERPPLWWLLQQLPWRWFYGVSLHRAQEIFDAMAATTCNPVTVPPPCIPFMFPDNGCWARAHQMCRLMIDMGVQPAKVWINGGLDVKTRNNPDCHVGWWWHVAPTIFVRRNFFFVERMVIDPALFTTPVSKAKWKSVQGDPQAELKDYPWTYYKQSGETDPTFSKTEVDLDIYRLALQARSTQLGPPPYANCP